MTLTIELTPEAEAWIEQQAERRGLDKNAYAKELIESQVPKQAEELTDEEFDRLLAELDAQTPDMPVIDRDLIDSRAFYYEGRE